MRATAKVVQISSYPHWSAQQTEAHAARVEYASWRDPQTGAMCPEWRTAITATVGVGVGTFTQPVVYQGRVYYSPSEWQMYDTGAGA